MLGTVHVDYNHPSPLKFPQLMYLSVSLCKQSEVNSNWWPTYISNNETLKEFTIKVWIRHQGYLLLPPLFNGVIAKFYVLPNPTEYKTEKIKLWESSLWVMQ